MHNCTNKRKLNADGAANDHGHFNSVPLLQARRDMQLAPFYILSFIYVSLLSLYDTLVLLQRNSDLGIILLGFKW